ncbi:MAG: phytochelatin synthase family protein [Rhodocyclaceae bacterium]|nr:phytochelatin synthase family protein [Rhodocyclaceae bacterium]
MNQRRLAVIRLPLPSRAGWAAALFALFLGLPAWAADLLYLNTPAGAERLVAARHRQHFFLVQPYLESQQNLAFCGPASIAAVLNSLDLPRPAAGPLYPYPFFTQDNVFTAATQRIKSHIQVNARGMTLAEFAAFLNALGTRATVHYADDLDLDGLRALVKATLDDPKGRLVVNYSRKPLGQAGDGHLSPLGAYDEASDSVLLLDVAKFKYPPVWISLQDLYTAIRTTDPDSGKSRGLVAIGG